VETDAWLAAVRGRQAGLCGLARGEPGSRPVYDLRRELKPIFYGNRSIWF
jgi:hypothetical protein